jgi:hypothetical protein
VLAIGKLESHNFTGRDGEAKTSTELNIEFAMKMPSGFSITSDDDSGGLPD